MSAVTEKNNFSVGSKEQLDIPRVLEDVSESFFNGKVKTSEDFLRSLDQLPELGFYEGKVDSSPDGSGLASDIAERKRTERSLETLFWIWNGDYQAIVASQPEGIKLSVDSFKDLQVKLQELLPDAEAAKAMIVTMLIHDLGKIQWLRDGVAPGSHIDHDELLYLTLKGSAELLPSFMALSPHYQEMIREGWATGLNVGQLTQGENSPGNLTEALKVRNINLEGFKFFLFHEILDVAGVLGHIPKFSGAFVLNENTYFAYGSAYKALVHSSGSQVDAYDNYLRIRADKLELDISERNERTVTRLCCMARLYSNSDGSLAKNIFGDLEGSIKQTLGRELNRSGVGEDGAILLYYAPQTLVNLLKNEHLNADKGEALKAGFTLLAKLYDVARSGLEADQVGVTSINISSIASGVAECKSFDEFSGMKVSFSPETKSIQLD